MAVRRLSGAFSKLGNVSSSPNEKTNSRLSFDISAVKCHYALLLESSLIPCIRFGSFKKINATETELIA